MRKDKLNHFDKSRDDVAVSAFDRITSSDNTIAGSTHVLIVLFRFFREVTQSKHRRHRYRISFATRQQPWAVKWREHLKMVGKQKQFLHLVIFNKNIKQVLAFL